MHDSPRPSSSPSTGPATPAPADELTRLHAYWRAANYLAVGQIYLLDNPLLREPLRAEHIKPRLLGHWGTSPGLNFVYAHLNRVINRRGADVLYVCGPGHGGPAMVANAWLEGTYSELYSHVSRDARGMARLFRQFSFPGGIPSHAAPDTPGSINEGGELGYGLAHAYGAAFDNPELVVACVVGDGEAETGALATSWHANKFLDPVGDGAVLPILHLNGYKIANPTVLARIPDAELSALFTGYGYRPCVVEGGFDGEDPMLVHQRMAAALDAAFDEIARIWAEARSGATRERPAWPMIVLRTPKGWTGPKFVDGVRGRGDVAVRIRSRWARSGPTRPTWRSSRSGCAATGPRSSSTTTGRPVPEIAALAPVGDLRMSASPHANGGVLLRDLELPDWTTYTVEVTSPGTTLREATKVLGDFLRDVIRDNPANFRLFGPDETASNRLQDVFEVTDRAWTR